MDIAQGFYMVDIKKALVYCQGRIKKRFVHFLRKLFVGIVRTNLSIFL